MKKTIMYFIGYILLAMIVIVVSVISIETTRKIELAVAVFHRDMKTNRKTDDKIVPVRVILDSLGWVYI